MKTLILHYSRTGHTTSAAGDLARALRKAGHDVTVKQVETKKAKMFYLSAGAAGSRQKDLDVTTPGIDLAPYDLVIVGAPVWSWKGCPIWKTYLPSCKGLKGKTIHAFWSCTSNPGSSQEVLAEQVAGMGATLAEEHLIVKERDPDERTGSAIKGFAKVLVSR